MSPTSFSALKYFRGVCHYLNGKSERVQSQTLHKIARGCASDIIGFQLISALHFRYINIYRISPHKRPSPYAACAELLKTNKRTAMRTCRDILYFFSLRSIRLWLDIVPVQWLYISG